MEYPTFALVNEDRDLSVAPPLTSYDADFHAWAMQQAELIKLRRFGGLDIENLADEVSDMARRVRKELVSRLSLVVIHLLKWDHQPGRRCASWARTIREQRRQVEETLEENPSLRAHLDVSIQVAFRQGRVAALNETGLPDTTIPEVNPYAWADLMARPIAWPDP